MPWMYARSNTMDVGKHGRLVSLTLLLFLLVVVCFTSPGRHGDEAPPNIIFFVADDLGWNDVGWHNADIPTPNLDRYAKQGVILNHSYVQHICSPSRSCFLTGLFPYHTGLQHLVVDSQRPKFVPKDIPLLPEKLKSAGYDTHMVGKWHLGFCNWNYTPTYRGFDTFFGYYSGVEDYYTRMQDDGFDFRFNTSVYHGGDGVYSAQLYAERAEEIIRNHDQKKPLFLYLPIQSVHGPLEVPKRFEDQCSHIQAKDRRIYCGMVSALDEAFQNVSQALEDSGIARNMLLIFTTDNGAAVYNAGNNWPLRGGKHTVWEGGTRGAAFVYSSNLLSKTGYTNDELIHAVDWFPTILEAAGVKAEDTIDGVSQLQTIISGASSQRTEFVYNIDELWNRSAIRMGDYKLIVGNAGAFNDWYLPPEVAQSSQQHNASADLPDFQQMPEEMLFNVREDPTERNDLAEKEPQTLQRLKDRLAFWMKSLVPAQNPPKDPKSDPKNFGGNWSPGWC